MENRNSFLAVDAADLEDFEDVIRQAGYSLSDFQLEEEACERPQAGPSACGIPGNRQAQEYRRVPMLPGVHHAGHMGLRVRAGSSIRGFRRPCAQTVDSASVN